MGKGDLSQRIEIETKDEVGILASAFNNMASEMWYYSWKQVI